jgi:hypothetical protein
MSKPRSYVLKGHGFTGCKKLVSMDVQASARTSTPHFDFAVTIAVAVVLAIENQRKGAAPKK